MSAELLEEIAKLERELAEESAVSLIECSCLSQAFMALGPHPVTWHDLRTADDGSCEAVEKAVRYLALRGLIGFHPENHNLVRLP